MTPAPICTSDSRATVVGASRIGSRVRTEPRQCMAPTASGRRETSDSRARSVAPLARRGSRRETVGSTGIDPRIVADLPRPPPCTPCTLARLVAFLLQRERMMDMDDGRAASSGQGESASHIVMVVEDDVDCLDALVDVLTYDGYRVQTA